MNLSKFLAIALIGVVSFCAHAENEGQKKHSSCSAGWRTANRLLKEVTQYRRIFMLSIRLNTEREWWVSSIVFDRLFKSALDAENKPFGLEHWRHVAHANGGLDLTALEQFEANALLRVLRRAAEGELIRLSNADPLPKMGPIASA